MGRATRARGVGALLLAISAGPACAQYELVPVGHTVATSGGAEISAFDGAGSRLYTTSGDGLDVYRFDRGTLTPAGRVECSGLFDRVRSVSSVAIDPAGRGFGIAAVIPEPHDTRVGLAAVFSTEDHRILATLPVGFNPDMVAFSPDGAHAYIANEGEPGEAGDPPGSLSVINLTALRRGSDAANLDAASVRTISFTPASLAPGVSLAGVRLSPRAPSPEADLEPEYLAPDDRGVWVSLQENNALARYDLDAGRWTAVLPLGGVVQTVDASDRDGGVRIDDPVFGLCNPDTIAGYVVDGRRYLVSANEGDRRGYDEVRFAEARIDPGVRALLDLAYGDCADPSALGRLMISTIDGDTDGDGDIDLPTMFGTRSFSVWDERGESVFDSGSAFEVITAAAGPELFNSDGNGASFDTRSDNSGPEPEGLALAAVDGRVLAFIGLERVGGVVMYDITEPAGARFLQYCPLGDEAHPATGPEGLAFVVAGGARYLVVSCEQSGTIEVLRLERAAGAGPG
jgi:hypothetical protein